MTIKSQRRITCYRCKTRITLRTYEGAAGEWTDHGSCTGVVTFNRSKIAGHQLRPLARRRSLAEKVRASVQFGRRRTRAEAQAKAAS